MDVIHPSSPQSGTQLRRMPVLSLYPASEAMALRAFSLRMSARLARSCCMCSALDVPVRGRIPMAREKAKTICAGVTFAAAACLRTRMIDDFHVGGEQGEALVNDVVLAAKGAYIAVPAEAGITAVLYERWNVVVKGDHLLKMVQAHIANAKKPRSAAITLGHHGLPDLLIVSGPRIAGRRAVQHKVVNVISGEMFERTG